MSKDFEAGYAQAIKDVRKLIYWRVGQKKGNITRICLSKKPTTEYWEGAYENTKALKRAISYMVRNRKARKVKK